MGKKRSHSEANNGGAPKAATPKKDHSQKDHKKGDFRKPSEGQKQSLVFTPRPDWHASELPGLPLVEEPVQPPRHVLDELHKYAVSLLEAENTAYQASHLSSSSSHKFLSTIMSSGTLEDKVSALTLLVQESPLHTMKAFENLINLARKKSRNQAMMSLGALKDLLGQGVVLPPDRKLLSFGKQPALISALQGKSVQSWSTGDKLPAGVQKIHLISWAYEDWLKRTYFELLKVLESWCNDEIEYSRSRAVTFVWELLKEKPEQEENLLRLLINKLGDTEKKIASRASYLLLQLQVTHPLMKSVIINAVESDLLFRPGQSPHAKYYAIITLNQTVLSMKEQEVANKLLEIYFALFVGLLKKREKDAPEIKINSKGQAQGGGGKPGKKALQKAKAKERASTSEEEMKEKMIAQILTGVNRAFPFAKTDDATFESQLDTIFRVTHSSNFNTSIQALMLIQQISATKHYSTDRFYRTLYESLLDPRLFHSSKQIMYLNLLYRALKSDVSIKRVKAFVKRLLQIVTLHEPAFACGVLYLISELITVFPSIKSMIEQPEVNEEDEEERYVDAPEDGVDGEVKPAPAATEDNNAAQMSYDGRKRDPEHSNADRSCLWELLPFQGHFHPSVSLFASRLLHQEAMPPKPDPTLHTLIHFLDRFAYRNPKSTAASKTRGVSIMQPLGGATTTSDILIRSREGGKTEAPLNTEAFWRQKAEDVPVDEVFFHEYFSKSGKKTLTKKEEKEKKRKEQDEDEGEDAEEDEIWKALVESRPEIEGPDEGDEDLDFDDLMSDEGDEDVDMDAGVELNLESDEDEDLAEGEDAEEGASDAGFDAAELEDGDEEAFVGSDDELPSDLDIALQGAESEEEAPKAKKAKTEDKKKKKRRLKHLPTFASVEDYAKLLEDDEDGM